MTRSQYATQYAARLKTAQQAFARFAGKELPFETKKRLESEQTYLLEPGESTEDAFVIRYFDVERKRLNPDGDPYVYALAKKHYTYETYSVPVEKNRVWRGMQREAKKLGMELRFSFNGMIWGMDYRANRVTIDLTCTEKGSPRVTNKMELG